MRWSIVDSNASGDAAMRHRRTLAIRALLSLSASAAIACSLLSGSASDLGAPKPGVLGIAAEALGKAVGGESLLNYAISCALPKGATVSGNDGTQFAGSLGLVPQWAERALNTVDQRWLSACLLARTNLFGVRVTISLRGSNPVLVDRLTRHEKTLFTSEEGAFYGNLWAQPQRAYACLGSGDNAVKERLKRVCTEESDHAGISRCGFQITGSCEDVCERQGIDGSRLACRGGDETYEEVITTFLKPD